ncbi:MAG TPA: hypothetical protein VFN74_03560 [Chloroflexota bacterium]|nr:hypothetical protein [Chloroflexota bacterium]
MAICTARSVVLRTRPRERLVELLETGEVVERPMSYGTAVAMVGRDQAGPGDG